MMEFISQINDHAFERSPKSETLGDDFFSPQSRLDGFLTPIAKKPVARRLNGHRATDDRGERVKRKRKPFWQIAPDGQTIERLYDPEQEPLDLYK